jgi:uncharacterized protein
MRLSALRKSQLIESNRREYGDAYASLRFVTEEQAAAAQRERSELLDSLRGRAVFCCKDTKVDGRGLSPGCEVCARGEWSCLFINGRCNCRCFYCPSRQDEDLPPSTNSLQFPRVEDYVDYVAKMGFTGVSFSGGEPLLILDDTLRYLTAIKDAFGDKIHTWLYTNGTLATSDKLQKLKEAGLDEIRFDIGAAGMKVDAAQRAVEYIGVVTVEIPAIPEDYDLMREKIREMEAAGIRHLNLHQLRLTPHNLPHLAQRDYTFLHGERVTVLESELTALRLIRWAYNEGVRLPINYCSFVYKNRFQHAAARRSAAGFIRKPYEEITESGFIRSLELAGEPQALARQIEIFRQNERNKSLWSLNPNQDRLQFSTRLWRLADFTSLKAYGSYSDSKLLPALTYRNLHTEIKINSQRRLYTERCAASPKIELPNPAAISWDNLARMFVDEEDEIENDGSIKRDLSYDWLESVRAFETIPSGLGEYF